MSVTVRWYNEDKQALVLAFSTPWDWQQFALVDDELEYGFLSVKHTVDLLIDLRQAGPMPMDMFELLADAYADATPNLGRYIFLGADAAFKQQMETAESYYQVYGGYLEYIFVETMAAAHQAIGQLNREK
ncbi:MAG: hypothetical protein KC708_19440 [Anaerolineae bacterium]|nr:hypothetical protein [Anaerolineae bacterium]